MTNSLSKSAITKIQAVILAAIILVVVIAGVVYYVTLPSNQPPAEKPFKIVIFTSGGSDNSWMVSTGNDTEKAIAYLRTTMTRNITLEYVYWVAYGDIAAQLRTYASNGYDLLIPSDAGYQTATMEVAQDYPETQFYGPAFSQPLAPNVGSWNWDVWRGYYLAGIAAGLATKTNIIGFVVAFAFEQANSGINAFWEGAKLSNPQMQKILYAFPGSWHDPVLGQSAAASLIAAGADVLAGMGNGMCDGMIEACKTAKVYGIGYLIDENALAPSYVLTSNIWNCTKYFVEGIPAAMNKQIGYKAVVLKLNPDRAAYLAPFHGTLSAEKEATANALIQKVYSGELPEPIINSTLPVFT